MKTERRHLRTCLAAAVASSDAEPVRKYSFSFGGKKERKEKKVFQPSSGNSVGSHIPPLSLMKALKVQRELHG